LLLDPEPEAEPELPETLAAEPLAVPDPAAAEEFGLSDALAPLAVPVAVAAAGVIP
jgi:hypothetical protein